MGSEAQVETGSEIGSEMNQRLCQDQSILRLVSSCQMSAGSGGLSKFKSRNMGNEKVQ
jgi:hypothetical protein